MLSLVLRLDRRHIPQKNFLILVSMGVGLGAGLAAVVLKVLAHLIHQEVQRFAPPYYYVTLFVYPVLGIFLTVLFYKFVLKRRQGKGLTDIILSIEKKSGLVESDKMYSEMVGGVLTVGFGGSTGLEAPIAVTGSAIGSNIARFFNFNRTERTVLLASGASAGIAAIFNSPIAGVLFAVEILLSEFSLPSVVPVLVATATASVLSRFLYSEQLFVVVTDGWLIRSIPFYILLGISMGFVSLYFTNAVLFVKNRLAMRRKVITRGLIGSLLLGSLVLLLPQLYGEGYSIISLILSGDYLRLLDRNWIAQWLQIPSSTWTVILLCILLVLIKPIAAAITLGAGGAGGVFGPSLVVGALCGFVFSAVLNHVPGISLPIVNFAAAGMAGALSGVLHAPLTAIFLIAEITGGYMLFVPLMLTAALAFFIARYFEPYTVYTKRIAKKGLFAGQDRDKWVLGQIKLESLIEKNFSLIRPDTTLGDLTDIVARSKRNLYPVVDDQDRLLGVILLNDIREIMFQRASYQTVFVKDLMTRPPAILHKDENMGSVMRKFEASNAWNLPVAYRGKYLGFVSKSAIFFHYRELLVRHSKEVQ